MRPYGANQDDWDCLKDICGLEGGHDLGGEG